MISPMQRSGRWPIMVLAGVLAAWIVPGQSAFARGGHGGVGHGGGFGGGGHWGGRPYYGSGYSYGYGPYMNPGGMGYSVYPGPVWTPWSWMSNSSYPGLIDGYGSGTVYGFPSGVFGYGSPYPYPDWPTGVIRRVPRHRGLRSVGVAPAVDPAWNHRRHIEIEK